MAILIKVENNQRDDILHGLESWIRDHGPEMSPLLMKEIENLMVLIACAKEETTWCQGEAFWGWERKAEWLRKNGYHLIINEINGGMPDEDDENKWMASIEGEYRNYAVTIGEAVEAVYKAVMTERKPKNTLRTRTTALKELRTITKSWPFDNIHHQAVCDAVKLMVEYGNRLKRDE